MADAVAVPILDVMTAGVRPALRLLLAASLLLLLVACTNVSNLLVARAASRQREFAVQLALGASVGRMTRQWLAETIAIAGGGAVVGVGLAAVVVQVFAAMGPANAPRLDQVAVRWPAVAFAGGVGGWRRPRPQPAHRLGHPQRPDRRRPVGQHPRRHQQPAADARPARCSSSRRWR